MNIYDEILHRLDSKVRIRSLFKDVSIEDMEKTIHKMTELVEEKKHEKELLLNKRAEKLQAIEDIQKALADHGLSVEDLASTTKKRRVTSREKFDFEYLSEDGVKVVWNGSKFGRIPEAFKSYLERTGKERSDCIVPD